MGVYPCTHMSVSMHRHTAYIGTYICVCASVCDLPTSLKISTNDYSVLDVFHGHKDRAQARSLCLRNPHTHTGQVLCADQVACGQQVQEVGRVR
jgi:hypothetical protein